MEPLFIDTKSENSYYVNNFSEYSSKLDTLPNTYFITVTGSGMPELDGLFVPSQQPPKESESGTMSQLGYWNGKLAWDRADGKCEREPSLSYSGSYKAWRIARLDGHLAYECPSEAELPDCDKPWKVYKKGVAPAPTIVIHEKDPREAK